MSRVGLVLGCLTLIECQRLVLVIVWFTLSGNVSLVLVLLFTQSIKCWSVFLCLLHPVTTDGLYYCVSYTVCQGLVCVLVFLILCAIGCLVFVRLNTYLLSEVSPGSCVF